MKKNKKKKDLKAMIISFIKSSKAIISVLIILVIILIGLTYHLMKTSKTYMFCGTSDYLTIVNGIISLNYDVNLIEGSDITYTYEEDFMVTEYKIGYYISKANTLTPLLIKSGNDDIGLSLRGLIHEESAYNLAEPYHNDVFFTKDNIKALENGLYFIIEAKTADGEEILDKIELSLTKVSK